MAEREREFERQARIAAQNRIPGSGKGSGCRRATTGDEDEISEDSDGTEGWYGGMVVRNDDEEDGSSVQDEN